MPPMRLQFSLIFIGMLLLLSACASGDAAAPAVRQAIQTQSREKQLQLS
jgi:hypothetical protein